MRKKSQPTDKSNESDTSSNLLSNNYVNNKEANQVNPYVRVENINRSMDIINTQLESLKSCDRCLRRACQSCKSVNFINCEVCFATINLCRNCRGKYDNLKHPDSNIMNKLKDLQYSAQNIESAVREMHNLIDVNTVNSKLNRLLSRIQELSTNFEICSIKNELQELKKDPRYITKIKIVHSLYMLSNVSIIFLFIMNMAKSYWNTMNFLFLIFIMIFLNHFFYHIKTRLEIRLEEHVDRNFKPEHELCRGIKATYRTTKHNFEFWTLITIPLIWIIMNIISFIPEWRDALKIPNCEMINGVTDCDYESGTSVTFSILQIILHIAGVILVLMKRFSFQKLAINNL